MPLRIERLKKVFLVMGVAVAVGMPPVSGDGEYFYSGGQKWYLESAGDSIAVRTLLPMTVQEAEAAMGTEGGQLEWKTARSFVDQRALLIPVRDPSPAKVAQLAGRLRRHPAVESLLLSHSFGGSAVVLTSDIVAQFGGAPSSADRDRIARKYGVKFVRPLGRYAPNGYLLRIVDFTGKSPLRVASSIYEKEGVLFCHPDFIWPKAKRSFTPDDPLYVNQWHLNNTGQAGTAGSDVNAPEAWDISMGAGVIIAVVDDGVDLDHEDFQATGKLLPGFDFDQNDNDPAPVREITTERRWLASPRPLGIMALVSVESRRRVDCFLFVLGVPRHRRHSASSSRPPTGRMSSTIAGVPSMDWASTFPCRTSFAPPSTMPPTGDVAARGA